VLLHEELMRNVFCEDDESGGEAYSWRGEARERKGRTVGYDA
jgi:hypothetical protein